MADTKPPGFVDPAKNNADVAAKQAAQDINGQSTVTGDFSDTSAALDALAAAKGKPPIEPSAPAAGTPPAAAAAPAAGTPPASVTPPAAAAPPAVPPAATPPPADDPVVKRAAELFKDSPSLPAGAAPKSSEAFASIKMQAAKDIVEKEKQIAELTKKLEESKNPSPEVLEQQKELESLREWRTKMDVDFDPRFKSFDADAEKHREFIYAQLRQSPAITEDTIAQIKKHGGPEMVNLTKVFAAVNDPMTQRLVESKVADIAQIKFNKDQAVKAAKENLTGYLGEREKQWKLAATQHSTETRKQLEPILAQAGWLKEKTPAADGSDKAAVEEHNAFVKATREQVEVVLNDDTPQMRAILTAGTIQLFNLQRVHEALRKDYDDVKAKLVEVTERYDKVKASSRTRLPESAAPAGGTPPPAAPKPESQINLRTDVALDNLAKSIMEKRAAAAA